MLKVQFLYTFENMRYKRAVNDDDIVGLSIYYVPILPT